MSKKKSIARFRVSPAGKTMSHTSRGVARSHHTVSRTGAREHLNARARGHPGGSAPRAQAIESGSRTLCIQLILIMFLDSSIQILQSRRSRFRKRLSGKERPASSNGAGMNLRMALRVSREPSRGSSYLTWRWEEFKEFRADTDTYFSSKIAGLCLQRFESSAREATLLAFISGFPVAGFRPGFFYPRMVGEIVIVLGHADRSAS